MIRLRSLTDGQQVVVPQSCAVEVLDQEGNVALLLLPDPGKQSLKLITAVEEPDVAKNYENTFGLKFSRVVVPNLQSLTSDAPSPQLFRT